jgi:acyl carrier protein
MVLADACAALAAAHAGSWPGDGRGSDIGEFAIDLADFTLAKSGQVTRIAATSSGDGIMSPSDSLQEPDLDVQKEVVAVVERVLDLRGRAGSLSASSPLLGHVAELDSMAVATLITSLEERFGFTVADDEIDGSVFRTVGTLVEFVDGKLRQ